MNKKHFLPLLLGVIMAGCTSDEVITGDGSLPADTEVEASTGGYLSISIVSAQSTGTRAAGDEYTEGDGSYQDGTSAENNVERVRFFFFNGDNAIEVKKNSASDTYNSYIDWYPSEADNNSGSVDHGTDQETQETVEKVLKATLGLSFKNDSDKPTSVLAVINPTKEILELDNPDLAKLKEVINDYKTGLHASNFVMSNSVYVKNEETKPEVVYATAITGKNICQTLKEAIDNPVTIYVERVLARLDFKVGMDYAKEIGNTSNSDYTIFKVKKPKETTGTEGSDASTSSPATDDSRYEVDGEEIDIYVQLLGWNITATTSNSRLVKEIYPSWTSMDLFGSSTLRWNTSDYHRSFWALNPESGKFEYCYGNFESKEDTNNGNFNPAQANKIPDPNNKNNGWSDPVYLQENASAYYKEGQSTDENGKLSGPKESTKVIIAAQLLDDKGEPLKLAEWAYKKYTLDNLKKQLASTVLNNLYSWGTDGSTTTGNRITPDDIDFIRANKVDTNEKAYYVYAVLSSIGENKKWTNGNAKPSNNEYLTTDAVNKIIRDAVNHAKVWKNGMTYYFFDVRHLGEKDSKSPGEFGIVRNHLYKTTVTKITGLGTPVYDPDQVIYPEKPEDDESIVSADVRILSWRIVSDNYELTW